MWIGYIEIDEEDENYDYCNPLESDEDIERYIGHRRREFHKEWFQYLDYIYD